MKAIKIQHNMATEFVGALVRYGLREDFNEQIGDSNYVLNKDILNWLSTVDKNISPFLSADIQLLVEDFPVASLSLWAVALRHNIDQPKDLIDYVDKMSGEAFLRVCFDAYGLENVNETITFDSEDDEIYQTIMKASEEEKEAKLFIQFKKSPNEVKKRFHNLLVEFYEQFFKEYEEEIKKIMDKKVKEHNERFKKNPKEFLEVISFGDFSKLLENDSQLRIYVCYMAELTLSIFDLSSDPAIIYGFGFEQRFDEKIMKEKSKDLFKALADEKRLEILRLIGKRKWYSNELAKHFGLTSATMSYHMTKLLDIGIIGYETGEQNKLFYKINEDKVRELFDLALKDILGQ